MKEYKRLTKKDKWGIIIADCKGCDDKGKCIIKHEKGVGRVCGCKIKRRLFELEDKIEQGTLIELPCKVGDTVYCVYSYCEDYAEIYCGKIRCLSISQNGTKWFSVVYDNGFAPEHILDEDWGITVFLTKAEAEAKLKELMGEEE